MTEQKFYEAMGRKQVALEDAQGNLATMHTEYDNLLSVLAKVGSGEIEPKMISVDLAARSWKLRAMAVSEASPPKE